MLSSRDGLFNGYVENNPNSIWNQPSSRTGIVCAEEKGHLEINFWQYDNLPADFFAGWILWFTYYAQ